MAWDALELDFYGKIALEVGLRLMDETCGVECNVASWVSFIWHFALAKERMFFIIIVVVVVIKRNLKSLSIFIHNFRECRASFGCIDADMSEMENVNQIHLPIVAKTTTKYHQQCGLAFIFASSRVIWKYRETRNA